MPYKAITLTLLGILGLSLVLFTPALAQQASLSSIDNATVTLYYYDNGNMTKGDIVPLPDNPQRVNWDPALAAPGMYTFSHVPSGQWYYLEADHNGNKWYATFYMGENAGTITRNVDIPPLKPASVEMAITPSPEPTPAASTPVPTAGEGPRATPGMTFAAAILAMALIAYKRR